MVSQEVTPRVKRELAQAEERTEAGKFFSPYTDIHETDRAVIVSMEVPGVDKSSIDIQLEKGVLTVKGTIDGTKYESLRPIYSEYNVGNFVRTFTVSPKIDGGANLRDRRRRRADGRVAESEGSVGAAHRRQLSEAAAGAPAFGRSRSAGVLAASTRDRTRAARCRAAHDAAVAGRHVQHSARDDGPGPSIEPPSALTPLTVVKSRFVSNVQRTASVVARVRAHGAIRAAREHDAGDRGQRRRLRGAAARARRAYGRLRRREPRALARREIDGVQAARRRRQLIGDGEIRVPVVDASRPRPRRRGLPRPQRYSQISRPRRSGSSR